MSPRALATWAVAAVSMVVLTNNPVYRVLVVLVALNLVLARRRAGVTLRPLLTFLGVAAAWTIVYNPLINHAGVHHLGAIPSAIPVVGGAITGESTLYGVAAALGVMAAALAVAPLVLVLEPTDVLEALPAALYGTGTALAAALNMVPSVARSFTRVREAERLRGGSPRRGPAALIGTLVPVALATIESSITLAEAMEARAYGSGPRTRYRQPRAGIGDGLVMVMAALAVAGVVALRVSGATVDWYPFPAATLPVVDVRAVVLCLLLATPLLVPPPHRVTAPAAT